MHAKEPRQQIEWFCVVEHAAAEIGSIAEALLHLLLINVMCSVQDNLKYVYICQDDAHYHQREQHLQEANLGQGWTLGFRQA